MKMCPHCGGDILPENKNTVMRDESTYCSQYCAELGPYQQRKMNMTESDDVDRAIAGGSAARIEPQHDEPPPLTIWQRLFNWLDSKISKWVSGG